jgi:hypothetical protein
MILPSQREALSKIKNELKKMIMKKYERPYRSKDITTKMKRKNEGTYAAALIIYL